MLSRVIAKNIGDVFWDTVYNFDDATMKIKGSLLMGISIVKV